MCKTLAGVVRIRHQQVSLVEPDTIKSRSEGVLRSARRHRRASAALRALLDRPGRPSRPLRPSQVGLGGGLGRPKSVREAVLGVQSIVPKGVRKRFWPPEPFKIDLAIIFGRFPTNFGRLSGELGTNWWSIVGASGCPFADRGARAFRPTSCGWRKDVWPKLGRPCCAHIRRGLCK